MFNETQHTKHETCYRFIYDKPVNQRLIFGVCSCYKTRCFVHCYINKLNALMNYEVLRVHYDLLAVLFILANENVIFSGVSMGCIVS